MCASGQSSDSLVAHLEKAASDSLRIDALKKEMLACGDSNIQCVNTRYKEGLAWFRKNYSQQRKLFMKLRLIKGIALAKLQLTNEAAKQFESVAHLSKEEGFPVLQAKGHYQLANILINDGSYGDALEHLSIARELFRQTNQNKMYLEVLLVHAGLAMNTQNWDQMHQLTREALNVCTKYRIDVYLGSVNNMIGNYHYFKGDFDSALYYYDLAATKMKEQGMMYNAARVVNNMANIYQRKKQIDKAISLYLESATFMKLQNKNYELANIYRNLAEAYVLKNNKKQALKYANMALDNTSKTYRRLNYEVLGVMAQALELNGQYKEALKYFKLSSSLRDSINNAKNQRKMAELSAKYDREQKEKEIDLLQKDKELQNAELAKQNAQLEQDRIQRWALFGGLAIALVFIGFIVYRFRISNIQKQKIESQKGELELKSDLLEEKNREVMDSIRYAERFQKAIFPAAGAFEKYLHDGFVFFRPKDVISGDFFWVEGKGDHVLFAAADCTGHGVPGAMVSVMCSNLLSIAVNEYNLTDPGKVLDNSRDGIIKKLVGEGDVQDGMDIALCSFNKKTMEVHFAGANNPLYIINKQGLSEIKADKQPVGKFSHAKSFTTHTVQVEKGDRLYLFSDGFADQFGGPKGKKFKYKPFKKLLESIQDHPMSEQPNLLADAFDEWKGDYEQVDDVCVMGVEIG